MIFDSDVMIWYFRKNPNALKAVVDCYPFTVSVVSIIELIQGAKDKKELRAIDTMFAELRIQPVHMTEEISRLAEKLVHEYGLSHSLRLADALIASSCLCTRQCLLTANHKHYQCIPELKIEIFKP